MSLMKRAVVVPVFLSMLSTVYASEISAFSFTYGSTDFAAIPNFTLGYKFSTTSAVRVDQLGLFVEPGTDLVDSHPVGLFGSSGTLLASVEIGSGDGSALIGSFRYKSVTPITLSAHSEYYIGALYASNADDYVTQPTSITGGAGLTYEYGTYGSQDDGSAFLSAPLTTAEDRFDGSPIDYFGPNMIVSAVPLPPALALFGSALLCLYLGALRPFGRVMTLTSRMGASYRKRRSALPA